MHLEEITILKGHSKIGTGTYFKKHFHEKSGRTSLGRLLQFQ
jgi:hypothetical protein